MAPQKKEQTTKRMAEEPLKNKNGNKSSRGRPLKPPKTKCDCHYCVPIHQSQPPTAK
jgi:hypothetical protein